MTRIILLCAIATSFSLFAGADYRFDQMEGIEAQEDGPQMQLRLAREEACMLEAEKRAQAEKIYGTTFSEKTLFFKIAAFANCAHFGFRGPHTAPQEGLPAELPQLPAYISYDDIKGATEGSVKAIQLFGQFYPIVCAQHDAWQPFEKLVKQYLPAE